MSMSVCKNDARSINGVKIKNNAFTDVIGKYRSHSETQAIERYWDYESTIC